MALGVLLSWSAAAAAGHPRVGEGEACATGACHPGLGRSAGGKQSVHEPVASGNCRACHGLSSAAPAMLLKGSLPERAGTRGARAWDVVLCTGCHESLRSTREGAVPATSFAAGRRDLHALHVRAAAGPGCISCHDPHAAPQPHLLRAELPARGSVRMPQLFREQGRGGWCQTGCHAPKSYTRE